MKIDSPNAIGISTGFGIPTGGTSGQIIQKVGNNNYNTQWVDKPGGIIIENVTIEGTTSNPTKGTTTIDKIVVSDNGNGLCTVTLNYFHNLAGLAGSGDYLFTLPGGYQFDPSTQPWYTAVGDPEMNGVESWIPGSSGLLAANGNLRMSAYAMAYDSTRFRIVQGNESIYSSNSSIRTPIGSSFYSFSTPSIGIQMSFTFKKA